MPKPPQNNRMHLPAPSANGLQAPQVILVFCGLPGRSRRPTQTTPQAPCRPGYWQQHHTGQGVSASDVVSHQSSFPVVSNILWFPLLRPVPPMNVVAHFVVQGRAEEEGAHQADPEGPAGRVAGDLVDEQLDPGSVASPFRMVHAKRIRVLALSASMPAPPTLAAPLQRAPVREDHTPEPRNLLGRNGFQQSGYGSRGVERRRVVAIGLDNLYH
jgi:hypothetical protein